LVTFQLFPFLVTFQTSIISFFGNFSIISFFGNVRKNIKTFCKIYDFEKKKSKVLEKVKKYFLIFIIFQIFPFLVTFGIFQLFPFLEMYVKT
jgi:hypothetical protein